jgi:hypothetical protein
LPVADARAWRGLTGAMLAWFVIDSAASVSTGAPVNAVSNAVFLATFLIPILASGVLAQKPARRQKPSPA